MKHLVRADGLSYHKMTRTGDYSHFMHVCFHFYLFNSNEMHKDLCYRSYLSVQPANILLSICLSVVCGNILNVGHNMQTFQTNSLILAVL